MARCAEKVLGAVSVASGASGYPLATGRRPEPSRPISCRQADLFAGALTLMEGARERSDGGRGSSQLLVPEGAQRVQTWGRRWAFVMKKHLSTHLLGKHGVGQRKERKFECDLCERSFSEKWALNNHMKLHSGEKPYKCAWPSCHYAFLNLSAMKDHYRTHTGERPFKCKLCNFASTTQSHLSRHKRVHTGEKPYRCPWCDYRYRLIDPSTVGGADGCHHGTDDQGVDRSNCAENIRKHILHTGKHEGVKMYNCPKCNYATNSPMEFRNHLKESHPDIENPDLAYLHAAACWIVEDRLIVAVFHIIDSEQRYRQAKRRQLAAAPASGMGL
ncbi:Zinc finger protein 407 [Collichthys lucidus]|uniref:Zinc finger protein 407 n=1 Tax=Collichthys lucidus TaxID=240159 RepID=A0A4V6ARN0_COLLU|nr:Zinc finger protein 407 [Collichthys lucidus]